MANARAPQGRRIKCTLEDAHREFRVGMSISGPPEMFGLPPDPGCGEHAPGTPGCAGCYPARAPVTVTAVDYETGTITLDSAPAVPERRHRVMRTGAPLRRSTTVKP